MRPLSLGFALLLLMLSGPVEAHSLRPGFLILEETQAGHWDATWTAPTAEPQLVPTVRGDCSMLRRPDAWTVLCPEGSERSDLVILGIQREGTEVVVRIAPLEGEVVMAGLSLGNESVPLNLSGTTAGGGGFGHWVRLGIEHILIGADHLLFVLGLVLLIATTRELLVTITSFTLAHSITLGGASLGLLSLPSAPVEAVIALSIVLLAVELIRPERGWSSPSAPADLELAEISAPGLDERSLSRRKPWLVAFVFGLLHGFGFAGVLGELGLPQEAIWMPLLAFNLGVEMGQLSFVAVIFLPTLWLRKAPEWARQIPAYVIGTVAAAWTFERVASFWGG